MGYSRAFSGAHFRGCRAHASNAFGKTTTPPISNFFAHTKKALIDSIGIFNNQINILKTAVSKLLNDCYSFLSDFFCLHKGSMSDSKAQGVLTHFSAIKTAATGLLLSNEATTNRINYLSGPAA